VMRVFIMRCNGMNFMAFGKKRLYKIQPEVIDVPGCV